MKLNCWVIDKSEDSFPVDVANGDTVGDLKEAVMKKKPHALDGFDADQLTVWKVSIEITKDLKNEISKYQLVDDDSLLAGVIVSGAFLDPLQGYLHVVVQTPFINAEGTLELFRAHIWGQNRVQVVGTDEIIDLSIYNLSQFNPLSTKILLVREEYRIAYKAIMVHAIYKAGDSSILLLTGQPGIGKTFFLLYFLFRRLQEREPVALQINEEQFAILDQRGVRLYLIHAEETFSIPKGIWTLSDSIGDQQLGPCDAFRKSKAHLLHTSSPSSHRWKDWVTQLSARMYIMDIWSRGEFRTLLSVSNLPVDRGLTLFDLYGSNVRTCFDILKEPTQEETHLRRVQVAATKFAHDFSKSFQELLELDFSAKVLHRFSHSGLGIWSRDTCLR